MADRALSGGDPAAVERLGRWLDANLGATALRRRDVPRGYTDGWRFGLDVRGGRFDLLYLVDARRRTLDPHVALAQPPTFPSFPHVETDGRVCVLNPMDEIDPDRPVEVARHLIDSARDVLGKGMAGENADDFRTEFLSYWNPLATGLPVVSLLDPSGPSRWVAARRDRGRMVVGENGAELRRWLAALGRPSVSNGRLERALLVWLPRPMLPAEYPATLDDLSAMVGMGEPPAAALLNELLRDDRRSPTVVLGACAGNGACFAAVTVGRTGRRPPAPRPIGEPRLARPAASAGRDRSLVRSAVERADPFWVHGRDGNVDLPDLRMATVGIVGCGSLGSPVARLLALAGVGALVLVDPQTMTWGNVGRHLLGGEAVGIAKAQGMKLRLGREFPHDRFDGLVGGWEQHRAELARCDLIVSTIGGWSDEAELDRWRLEAGGPPVVYGWSEPRACAGHAVLVEGGGCLACGFDPTGLAWASVTAWSGDQLRREPACGAFFQPYGAVEITAIAGLVAGLALDRLLGRARPGAHRLLSAPETVLAAAGGGWSAEWIKACGDGPRGGVTIERGWTRSLGCPVCRRREAA